jgi:hypothetical protein
LPIDQQARSIAPTYQPVLSIAVLHSQDQRLPRFRLSQQKRTRPVMGFSCAHRIAAALNTNTSG